MKIKFIVMFIVIYSVALFAKANPIDTTLHILKNFNFQAYVNKPVDSLLRALPPGYTQIRLMGSHNYKVRNHLVVFYSNECYVWIRVETFRYFTKTYDYNQPDQGQWDISQFKKEKIAWTVLYQRSVCIKGCDKEFL